jgi:spore maturation protein CgeB
MANGALVLSEPVYDCYPFVEGRHFISAPVEDMPAVIQRYLRDESARRAITDEAYRFVTNELTTVKSVTTLASWMNE